MSNPYEAPTQIIPQEDRPPRRLGRIFWWLSIPTALLALGLGLIASFAIPGFENVYRGFGASLPSVTQALVTFRLLLWIPAALIFVLLAWARKSPEAARERAPLLFVFGALLILEVALYPVIVHVLYEPIVNLAEMDAQPAEK